MAAQSEVFNQMFLTDCIESKTGEVQINDASVESINAFVEFLHLGAVESMNSELAKDLLVLSDKYIVKLLKVTF